VADQGSFSTSVPLATGKLTSYRKDQLHDLRRTNAERGDGEIGTDRDNAIAEFIEWAFSSDRDDVDE
jgi:hypothetical protein